MQKTNEVIIKEEIRMLREAMAVTSNVAGRVRELIKNDRRFQCCLEAPMGNTEYSIELEDLADAKIIATFEEKI